MKKLTSLMLGLGLLLGTSAFAADKKAKADTGDATATTKKKKRAKKTTAAAGDAAATDTTKGKAKK
jgi:hypothetical protein